MTGSKYYVMSLDVLERHMLTMRAIIDNDYYDEYPDRPRTRLWAAAFKNFIKDAFQDTRYELVSFTGNHRDGSGFLTDPTEGTYVYVSCGFGFQPYEYETNILIRTAKSPKDFTGGPNHCTSMKDFHRNVVALFDQQETLPF